MDLWSLRSEYTWGALEEKDLEPDPFAQFALWLQEALAADIPEPHGMTLSTVKAGRPSSRVVLVRGYSHEGLVFYTNYQSRKGQELDENPWACANFWWPKLERQIRFEGEVHKTDTVQSDAYFASRPRESQLASLASPQSQTIASREVLEGLIEELGAHYPNRVPRPEHWGGYCLKPTYIEFWQGRKSRLHDRFIYTLEDAQWKVARLAP
jgi:pyridoxamine 5'-phosphate oxidase